jgi:hypothetical protein
VIGYQDGGRPRGQLERALASLTVGVAQGEQERRRALYDTATGEYEQQVQVPLSGTAAAAWAYTDQPVNWEMPFLYAPLQRRVPFQTPHFTYGIEHTVGTNELVVIHAMVTVWTISPQGWCVGATIRFAVAAPALDPTLTTPYAAVAHLRFQGYATMAEGDDFQT